jgi:hypothetical protein
MPGLLPGMSVFAVQNYVASRRLKEFTAVALEEAAPDLAW